MEWTREKAPLGSSVEVTMWVLSSLWARLPCGVWGTPKVGAALAKGGVQDGCGCAGGGWAQGWGQGRSLVGGGAGPGTPCTACRDISSCPPVPRVQLGAPEGQGKCVCVRRWKQVPCFLLRTPHDLSSVGNKEPPPLPPLCGPGPSTPCALVTLGAPPRGAAAAAVCRANPGVFVQRDCLAELPPGDRPGGERGAHARPALGGVPLPASRSGGGDTGVPDPHKSGPCTVTLLANVR